MSPSSSNTTCTVYAILINPVADRLRHAVSEPENALLVRASTRTVLYRRKPSALRCGVYPTDSLTPFAA